MHHFQKYPHRGKSIPGSMTCHLQEKPIRVRSAVKPKPKTLILPDAQENHLRAGSVVKPKPKIRTSIIFLTSLMVAQMVAIACLLCVWHNVRQPIQPREVTMCMTVENDTENKWPQKLTNITEDGGIKFCGKASDVLKWTIEHTMEDLYDGDEYPEPRFYKELMPKNCEETGQVPQIRQFTEIDIKKTNNMLNKQSILYWNSASGNDTTVVIHHDGLYRISSHIMLKTDKANIHVRHSLHRKRNGTEKVIMEDKEELCEAYAEKDTEREITTAMTAMFELKNNDELYLTISHPEYIVNSLDSSIKHHFTIFQT